MRLENMDAALFEIFELQRFIENDKLSGIIADTLLRRGQAVDDDDLNLYAAGETGYLKDPDDED